MKRIEEAIRQSIQVKERILSDFGFLSDIERISEICVAAFKKGNKILFCGNGGSAADAQHLAAELSGRFYFDREPLPAEALHVNTSFMTAVANDYSYDKVYARLVRASGKPGDILFGLSTSGNSPNVILAFEEAAKKDMVTVSLTGISGGKLKPISDHNLSVPSDDTPRIQEAHILIGHLICEHIENKLFNK
jgi:D-sedoheptulose 7-phosphate isomerase